MLVRVSVLAAEEVSALALEASQSNLLATTPTTRLVLLHFALLNNWSAGRSGTNLNTPGLLDKRTSRCLGVDCLLLLGEVGEVQAMASRAAVTRVRGTVEGAVLRDALLDGRRSVALLL